MLLLAVLGSLWLMPPSGVSAQNSRIVPADTRLDLRLDTALDSRYARPGDAFRARVTAPVAINGQETIPEGSSVNGRVINVVNESNKAFGRPSGITLQVDSLTSTTGVSVNIIADLADQSGTPFVTVDNLPQGSRVTLRVNRAFSVGPDFYGSQDMYDSADTVSQAQAALRDRGYYTGRIDGRLTPATRAAIAQFQRDLRLSATGYLDRDTLARLGLLSDSGGEVLPVNVISANANIETGGALAVRIVTQPTPGVRVFEDHFRFRDALHIYVRGFRATAGQRPTGELMVRLTNEEWRGITSIVVHGSGNDIVIRATDVGGGGYTADDAAVFEGKVSDLLAQYSRILGLRYDRFTGQLKFTRTNYRENEVELLFALNSLASATRMYTQLLRTTEDRQAISGGTDMVVAQANALERSANRTRSPRAASVIAAWQAMRDDVRRLSSNGSRQLQEGNPQ